MSDALNAAAADALRLRTETSAAGPGVSTVTVTIIAEGELDLFTAPLLRDSYSDALARISGAVGSGGDSDGGELVLDLRGVYFIDSAGLAILIGGHKATGGRFAVVVSAGSQVARTIKMGLLDRYMNVRVVTPGAASDAASGGAESHVGGSGAS